MYIFADSFMKHELSGMNFDSRNVIIVKIFLQSQKKEGEKIHENVNQPHFFGGGEQNKFNINLTSMLTYLWK